MQYSVLLSRSMPPGNVVNRLSSSTTLQDQVVNLQAAPGDMLTLQDGQVWVLKPNGNPQSAQAWALIGRPKTGQQQVENVQTYQLLFPQTDCTGLDANGFGVTNVTLAATGVSPSDLLSQSFAQDLPDGLELQQQVQGTNQVTLVIKSMQFGQIQVAQQPVTVTQVTQVYQYQPIQIPQGTTVLGLNNSDYGSLYLEIPVQGVTEGQHVLVQAQVQLPDQITMEGVRQLQGQVRIRLDNLQGDDWVCPQPLPLRVQAVGSL